jgi:hypothetical protein
VPEPEPEPEPAGPVPGADADGDGLTDVEERMIYGSDPQDPDTDGDTYHDGLEVENRYNPAGLAPRTLLEAQLVKMFEADGFSFLYPFPWSATVREDGAVELRATTGETVTYRPETRAFTVDLGLKTTIDYRATIDMIERSLTVETP